MPCRPLALAFILLLAGQQVQQISAVRENDFEGLASEEHMEEATHTSGVAESFSFVVQRHNHGRVRVLGNATPPKNSEGCKRKGIIGFGECQPKEFCMYKKVWGGLARDASCRLMPAYWSDVDTATSFGSATGRLLVKSQKFRKSGGLRIFHSLKMDLEKVSEAESGMQSSIPEVKTVSQACRSDFATQTISRYYTRLSVKMKSAKKPLKRLELFDVSEFAGDGEDEIALNRTMSNIETGAQRTAFLNKVFGKINFQKLTQMQKSNTKPTQRDFEEALPGIDKAIVGKGMREVQKKEDAIKRKCQSSPDDEWCILEARERAEQEKVAELAVKADADGKKFLLIQKLEAMGHRIHVKDDPVATHESLLQFLDENTELLQGDEYEEVRGLAEAALVASVGFVVWMFICTVCSLFGPLVLLCFFIGLVVLFAWTMYALTSAKFLSGA